MSFAGAADAHTQHLCGRTTFGGAMHLWRSSVGTCPSSRHGLGPWFVLEGGAQVSWDNAGEQMLLLVCAFSQASCLLALALSSLELFSQEVHGSREKPHPQQCLPKQEAEAEGPP